MTDHSHVTFGKYGPDQGDHRLMKDIPAKYYLWLWDNVLRNTRNTSHFPVREYVRNAYRVLLSECPDYIPQFPPE